MADITAAFVRQYEAEVHVAYQQGGSRLRNSIRVQTGVVGSSTTFTKIGKGQATQKTRKGDVVIMDIDHSQVECQLSDWYAPDYVDKLDEYKIQHDERKVLALAGAYAVGRKVDELIITAAVGAMSSDNTVGTGTGTLTLDNCLEAFAKLNEAEVPDDGQRYAVVGPRQWNSLLKIDQFARSEYVGDDYAWLKGREAKRWLNIIWMMHTGLAKTGTGASTATKCMLYHKTAIGLGENGQGVKSEINYVPHKAAHLCNNMISCGAVVIDSTGLVGLHVKDQ